MIENQQLKKTEKNGVYEFVFNLTRPPATERVAMAKKN
jgi:hypothetical protein